MENNALITFTMILPIIELCMGIANAVSVKDKIQYPINNPANIHSCDFVPFHAVLNTSDIINLGSIIYNICFFIYITFCKWRFLRYHDDTQAESGSHEVSTFCST